MLAAFADGVRYICEAHASVAQQYLDDGTADALVPPLRTLVEEGLRAGAAVRAMLAS